MTNARDKALELVENGMVTAEDMLTMALKYMSTDDVEDMLDANELSERFEDEDDFDCDDGDDGYALSSAGFGTDEDYGYYGEDY
jgi:hypothetical protein